MPIKRENRNRYPKNWKDIREKIRERADNRCEFCGMMNYSYVNKFTREPCLQSEDEAIRIVCTVAHMDHTPENCDESNLRFLCQKCHNQYDTKHRTETRRKEKTRNQPYILFKKDE